MTIIIITIIIKVVISIARHLMDRGEHNAVDKLSQTQCGCYVSSTLSIHRANVSGQTSKRRRT